MNGRRLLYLRYLTPTYLRLYWRLLRDRRAPLWPKLLLAVTAAYVVSPVDLIPDWLAVVGWVDDLLLLVLALYNLVRQSPREVVAEHLHQIDGGRSGPA